MTDLVKRLRNNCSCNFPDTPCGAEEQCRNAFEAADRIEHLENRCANLLVGNGILNNRIKKLETQLKEVSMWKLREQLGGDKSRYGLPTNEQYYDHIILDLREESANGESTCSKLVEDAADYIEGMQYQLRCDHSWKSRAEKLEAALRAVIDWDNTLEFEDGLSWGDVMDIARKALEGKDG